MLSQVVSSSRHHDVVGEEIAHDTRMLVGVDVAVTGVAGIGQTTLDQMIFPSFNDSHSMRWTMRCSE